MNVYKYEKTDSKCCLLFKDTELCCLISIRICILQRINLIGVLSVYNQNILHVKPICTV